MESLQSHVSLRTERVSVTLTENQYHDGLFWRFKQTFCFFDKIILEFIVV